MEPLPLGGLLKVFASGVHGRVCGCDGGISIGLGFFLAGDGIGLGFVGQLLKLSGQLGGNLVALEELALLGGQLGVQSSFLVSGGLQESAA